MTVVFFYRGISTCWIGMTCCKPCAMPVDTNSNVASDSGAPVSNASDFRSLSGALQYLNFTSYAWTSGASPCSSEALPLLNQRHNSLGAISLNWWHRLMLWYILTLIGQDVATSISPPHAMPCSYAKILSQDLPSARTQSPGRAPKPSIVSWQMQLEKPHGCASYSWSYAPRFGAPHWSTTTTSKPSTFATTLFSISVPSTSRSIFTSSVSVWPLLTSAFFICPHPLGVLMSSLRVCPPLSSRSSGPVWTFVVTMIRLRGCVRQIGLCPGGPYLSGRPH